MLKDKDTQPTLFQEDSHANHSQLQENEEDKTMIVTSGMKLLELLPKQNQNGLLAKMLKGLLTSTTAWYSDRCKLIWKKKVSKSNVLLYQLQASVHGIKEKEFGLLHTPTATEIGMRSEKAMEKRKKYRESIGRKTVPPGNLLEQMQMMYPTPTQDSASERTKKYKQGGTPLTVAVKMFPTPTVGCEEGGEQSKRVEQTKSGAFILRKKNKTNSTFGAKLSDAMLYLERMYKTPTTQDARIGINNIGGNKHRVKRGSIALADQILFPTPTARDFKDAAYQPTWKKSRDQSLPRTVLKNNKLGGKLNPNFVEFLMGYPMNWTKIDPTE